MRRFGVDHVCPMSHKTNKEKFLEESADCEAVKWMLNAIGVAIPTHQFDPPRMVSKIARTLRFARVSVDSGVLSEESYQLIKNEVARASYSGD